MTGTAPAATLSRARRSCIWNGAPPATLHWTTLSDFKCAGGTQREYRPARCWRSYPRTGQCMVHAASASLSRRRACAKCREPRFMFQGTSAPSSAHHRSNLHSCPLPTPQRGHRGAEAAGAHRPEPPRGLWPCAGDTDIGPARRESHHRHRVVRRALPPTHCISSP